MIEDILLVNGVPRSGTSVIGAKLGWGERTAYRFQPLFSYKYREQTQRFMGKNGLEALVRDLETCDDNFIRNGMSEAQLNIKESKDFNAMVIKEVRYHEFLSEWLYRRRTRLLCVIRDPRACIYSQTSIPAEWRGSLDEFPDWLNAPHINEKKYEYFGLAGWLRFCYMAEFFEQTFPDQVRVLRYEDFCESNSVLQQIVDELKLPIEVDLSDGDKGRGTGSYGISGRSGKNWRNSLDATIQAEIESVVTKLGKERYLCD